MSLIDDDVSFRDPTVVAVTSTSDEARLMAIGVAAAVVVEAAVTNAVSSADFETPLDSIEE